MRHIPTLIPTDFAFRTALILIIYAALAAWDFIDQSVSFGDAETLKFGGLVTAFLILVSLFDLYLRREYKVSYDDSAIYWRKVGFRGKLADIVVMPFEAITEVFAEPGSLGVKPFEVAVIRAGEKDISDILLSRLYLRKQDIIDLLALVSERSEAAFEDDVRDFIQAG